MALPIIPGPEILPENQLTGINNERYLLFLRTYCQTGDRIKACQEAGYTGDRKQLSSMGSKLIKRLREPLRVLMRAMGMDATVILAGLRDGMTCNTVTRRTIKVPYERVVVVKGVEKTVWATRDEVVEYHDPDYPTRLEYLRTAAKLYGMMPAPSPQVTINTQTFDGAMSAFIGFDAADEEHSSDPDRDAASESELLSDISEIQRRLALVGYEIKRPEDECETS